MQRCRLVAEIGCTHIGSLDRAKMLCELAARNGADYVKTQKRNPTVSTPHKWHDKPHPKPEFAYGKTYLEHRTNLELSIDEHIELMEYCKSLGVGYTASVWDVDSAKEFIQLDPDFIKIGSPSNLNFEMLDILLNEYKGDVHISLGMTYRDEIDKIEQHLIGHWDKITIYHAVSEYPCPFEHLYLLEITNLIVRYRHTGCNIGFSDHSLGICMPCVAYAMGATSVEKHFIDDRTFPHSDSSASLEPQGLQKLRRDLDNIYKAMQHKTDMSSEEIAQRDKLKSPNF